MAISTNTLDLRLLVPEASIRADLEEQFRNFRSSGAPEGGLTLQARRDIARRRKDRPRGLAYWGPLPSDADRRIDPLLRGAYTRSSVRDTDAAEQWATATADAPYGY